MERWLSKSRVLQGLCVLMLIAAFNRRDPMAYGVFLFLAVICALGYLLPWLSLRGMQLRWLGQEAPQVTEGQAYPLHLVLERHARWPAFLVDIEAEWVWASQRLVMRHTVALVRRGRSVALEQLCTFPCRGVYRLESVCLASGFPLGLLRAQLRLHTPELEVQVLPQPSPFVWPLPWTVTADPLGERATRHLGPSMELGLLRAYQDGEPLGRVSWRASARAGQLVIQHFQQTGSLRLHVLVAVPDAHACGQPDSDGEQAIRLAAGIVAAAQAHHVQLRLHLPLHAEPLTDPTAALLALAGAPAVPDSLPAVVHQALPQLQAGEQLAVVLPASLPAPLVLQSLLALDGRGGPVLVCLAHGAAAGAATPQALAQALAQAGYLIHTEGA